VRELLLYSSFAVPIYLVLIFLGLTLFTGVSSRFTEDEDREWWARASAWILISIVVWGAASFLVLVGPPLTSYLVAKFILPAGGLVGIVTALAARSANSPAKDQKDAKGIKSILMSYALPLGSIIFLAFLIVSLSIGTNYLLELLAIPLRWLLPKLSFSVEWLHNQKVDPQRSVATDIGDVIIFPAAREIYILIGLAALIGWLAAKYINTNKFSHHAMYRNRIIRAYLGASRRTRDRHPDPFTGFDPADNLSMCDLRPQLLHSGSFNDAQQQPQPTFAKFVTRLKAKADAASQYMVDEVLTKDTVKLLDQAETDHSLVLLENAVIKDLNQALLKQEEILPPKSNTPKSQEAWVNYNRQLLQDAFNDFIRPVPPSPRGPLHVVNMTLNLVHGDRLAWQQRKAESFTVTPLHSGSFQIPDTGERGTAVYGSYRRSHEYAGSGGITIGTAVAISGAAVSPNMGYYSSPIVTLLMTLFNVRLGWWLGNPGPAGAKQYHHSCPKSALYPIVAEALGLTDDHSSYVYLTDGGHFENLGLYEMVLRRCRLIVVSDASDDANFQFDNLGNAVKKIRIDFGIPIDFKSVNIFPRSEKKKGAFCAIGTIRYSCVDKIDKLDEKGQSCEVGAPDGLIVYIKPVFYGDEPRDVYHYAMTHETFPHESTVDQWFSETQFESYRKLGSYVVDTICKYPTDGGPREVWNEPALKTFYDKAEQSSKLDEPDGARSPRVTPACGGGEGA
jgi:hypothetical protein